MLMLSCFIFFVVDFFLWLFFFLWLGLCFFIELIFFYLCVCMCVCVFFFFWGMYFLREPFTNSVTVYRTGMKKRDDEREAKIKPNTHTHDNRRKNVRKREDTTNSITLHLKKEMDVGSKNCELSPVTEFCARVFLEHKVEKREREIKKNVFYYSLASAQILS